MRGSCHCGAVVLEVDDSFSQLTACNCSICGRLGALWAYTTQARVTVKHAPDALASYAWGDRTITFHHCRVCGCTTHYTGLGAQATDRVAVNARLLPLDPAAPVPVRRWDGRDTWSSLGVHDAWPW